MTIGIGIDTGGTYTDAVVYDFDAASILGSAKALTTRDDLSLGIVKALDGLPSGAVAKADFLSLSTTLATNACVENRMGRARLVFFMGDPVMLDRHGAEYGLPPTGEILRPDCLTSFSGTVDREPDWERFAADMRRDADGLDGVAVVELNAFRNGAAVELKAREALEAAMSVPVVCAHELSSGLNSLQRGATAFVNASLFPIAREFAGAIRTAMAKRGLDRPVVIVRSDASLMDMEFAARRPVETLLSGPAASVVGGAALAGEENCVVVDMGGTTTDIAVVERGSPVKTEDGVGVGRWRTFVQGLRVRTFGLGGDSAVRTGADSPILESLRVIPLCVACAEHPELLPQLEELAKDGGGHPLPLQEGFFPVRDIDGNSRYTERERCFCGLLREKGPMLLGRAAKEMGIDVYNLHVSRLVREGAVRACGFTPTDVMHLRGDFTRYDARASGLGARFVAAGAGLPEERLLDWVYGEIRKKLYMNVVRALLENERPEYRRGDMAGVLEQFIADGYAAAAAGGRRRFVASGFRTEFALVGVGAPIHLFLHDVAAMLGTRAVVPEHSDVANALGAVVGKIHAVREVEVRPEYCSGDAVGYVVFAEGEAGRRFEKREDAEAFAAAAAEAGVRAEAARRGAAGAVSVTCRLESHDGESRWGSIYLGTTAVAQAVGAPRLGTP